MVTPDSSFRDVIRISRDGFGALLSTLAAKPVIEERDPRQYWDQCVADRIDPLFIAAMFMHESSMGRAGVAVQTHSWGNTRKPNFGATPIGEVPGRTGTFPVWRDWLDGLKSTTGRLNAHEWVYFERDRIREIFDWPPDQTKVWAPAGDLNNPNGYLRAVIDFMNKYQDRETDAVPPAKRLIEMYDHVPVIDTGQVLSADEIARLPNFPHRKLRRIAGMTWHETGNANRGANAVAHRNFVANGGGAEQVSYQWTVDSERIIQITPVDEACWHAGDGANGAGNMETNAVEICINSDGDFMRALYNAAYLGAWFKREYGPTPGYDRQHNAFSGKNCPQQIRERGLWEWFLQGIADWSARLAGEDGPRTRKIDGVGGSYEVGGKILTAYEALETIGAVWWTVGVPAGPEQGPVTIDDTERWVQPFDRSWLMTEGDGAVIPKPAQLVAIKKQLGIETGTDVRLDVLRGLLGTAKDSIDAAISEVAD